MKHPHFRWLLAGYRALAFASAFIGLSADSWAGPATAQPDRVVLTWSGDPASTQAVTWRTDTTVANACAEIMRGPDGPVPKDAIRVAARSEEFTPKDAPAARLHSVEFSDLSPDTAYLYRVGDGKTWSEWHQFRTARAVAAPFTFLFLGDAQTDIRAQWSRVWRQAWLTVPDAAFAVMTGDLVNHGNNDDEWSDWFQAVGWVGATRPLVLAPGSHEHPKVPDASGKPAPVLSNHWRSHFTYPTHGPEGTAETCYFFDYQGVRFIVMNAVTHRAEQSAWLRSVLSGPRPKWTVLAFHDPIFSGGQGRDAAAYRALWKPVIDDVGVDLVLSGHDHVYARSSLDSVPIGYPSEKSVVNRTVYVVAVSGPKMYELSAGPWAHRKAAKTKTFQAITVEGDELRYKAWTATGSVMDAFTLRKQSGARNELIEESIPNI